MLDDSAGVRTARRGHRRGLLRHRRRRERRPWVERKQSYLAHLAGVEDEAVLRVVLADKVHNARSIVRDYREEGEALWERFGQRSAEDQLRYYRGLLEIFGERGDGPLFEDLLRAVAELDELTARGG